MKGKGGMALMIAIGKKKPGMGSERPSSPSLASEEEDSGMDMTSTLEPLAKAFFEAGSKGKYKQAAQLFHEMQKCCGGEGYEEED
jgi:hypothetical protein